MKKFVLLFLTSMLLISLLFPFGTKDATELQIVQQEQQGQVLSSKIRYYYNLQVINYDGGVTNAATPMNYEYISFYNLRSDAWTINLIKAGENYTDYCDWGTVTWVSE